MVFRGFSVVSDKYLVNYLIVLVTGRVLLHVRPWPMCPSSGDFGYYHHRQLGISPSSPRLCIPACFVA